MKETIYTIPVNEAYGIDCECPLCELEKRLEREAVEYSLGGAMMEPDFRMISNEKGYCTDHYKMMFKTPSKLQMALVLDTHLMEIRKKLDKLNELTPLRHTEGKRVVKKSTLSAAVNEICKTLDKTERSCVICDKVNDTMNRYIDVLLYMWANDDAFKEKFNKSKGVCLRHFRQLSDAVITSLKGGDAKAFLNALLEKEIKELERIQEDIHKFTLKFDYRNHDMPWGTAKDAPQRTIEKLSGYMENEE